MIFREQYREDPCAVLSIPYWKAEETAVPDHMKILHHREFRAELLEEYDDELYFRLIHDLQKVSSTSLPEGFRVAGAEDEELAAQITSCYGDIAVSSGVLREFRDRAVWCPELWIVVRDEETGEIAASGIGELDKQLGEGILEWIQVSEKYRGRGLGAYVVTQLLLRMQGKAFFATVSGRCGNPTKPELLYRRCGFTGDDVWHVMKKRGSE